MDPIVKPDPDERADWSAIFGETPGASAYERQVAEFRSMAFRSAKSAQDATDAARHAETVCRRTKALAESMVERQERFVRIANTVRICTWVTAVSVALVLVFNVARMVW